MIISENFFKIDPFSIKLEKKEKIFKKIINNLNKHHFKNWYCYAGIDIIHLDHEGDIRYGGACPVSTNSNITDNKYNLPIEPVRCPVKVCHCCDDIECRKSTYVK